jgi:hypothetical protein
LGEDSIGFFFLDGKGRFRIPEVRGKGYSTEEEAILAVIGRKMVVDKKEVEH